MNIGISHFHGILLKVSFVPLFIGSEYFQKISTKKNNQLQETSKIVTNEMDVRVAIVRCSLVAYVWYVFYLVKSLLFIVDMKTYVVFEVDIAGHPF